MEETELELAGWLASSKWLQMASNGSGWFHMDPNSSNWIQLAPNSSNSLQISPNGSQLLQMDPDVSNVNLPSMYGLHLCAFICHVSSICHVMCLVYGFV